MDHLARVAAPELPYHVMQRGNRRLPTNCQDDDRHDLNLPANTGRRQADGGLGLMLNHACLIQASVPDIHSARLTYLYCLDAVRASICYREVVCGES